MHVKGQPWTKDLAIQDYKEIVSIYGNGKGQTTTWMVRRGYSCLVTYVIKTWDGWDEFNSELGIEIVRAKKYGGTGRPSKWTKEKAIKEYQEARKLHGEKARSWEWMRRNGYVSLVMYTQKAFGLWKNFKKQAGFDEERIYLPLTNIINTIEPTPVVETPVVETPVVETPVVEILTKEKAIKEYRKARELHRENARSAEWMRRNGYEQLVYFSRKKTGGWKNFKKQAGFIDFWTKEKAIKEYRKARKLHGEKARSWEWMRRNGYIGLVMYTQKAFGLWKNFREIALASCKLTIQDLMAS